MQGGLILFSQSERHQPLAQIHSLVHKLSRGAVTQNLFSGRDKGRDVPTALRDVCAGDRDKTNCPGSPTSRWGERTRGTRLWRENQGRRRANRAIPTFTALFRLRSYQGLQEITCPLLQRYLKQTPYFINPYFSGLQESFPLRALG